MEREGPRLEPLPEGLIAALEKPDAYPEDASAAAGVETIQTHISYVFLTRYLVYKLRKAVDLGFVRFAERAERNADCLREVALNRRLAPDVYLGVAPILRADGRVRVGPIDEELARSDGAGEIPEHCVVMRRLPEGGDALSLLQARALRGSHVEAIAELVARFHLEHRLGAPAPFSPEEWMARLTAPVEANFEVLERVPRQSAPARTLRRVAKAARRFVSEHAEGFETRRADGKAVDGHGDLHLQHVWFEERDAPPLVIDCVEFREDLRRIDAASDVAFLAMDLEYCHRPRMADRLLRAYAAATDDFDLYRVVDYYRSYRAAVRAKVAALAAEDEAIPQAQREVAAESARAYLRLAARALARRGKGALVILCGVVGTGKSTAAQVAADRLRGAVVSSDRVRKHLAGIAPTARARVEERDELYGSAMTERVYAGLLERAEPILDSGRVAVLDATFASAERRKRVRAFALRRGVPVLLIETRCAPSVILQRLARREADDRDASDAGPALYGTSRRLFQSPRDWPDEDLLVVWTDTSGWRGRLRRSPQIRALTARARGRP